MRTPKRRPASALFLAVIIAVIAVACSGPKAAPPPPPTETLPVVDRSVAVGVKASLNETTGEVILPMDKYWYTDKENVLVNSAVAYLIEDCVRASGHIMVGWGGDGRALQDFSYGQWSRPLAARNGNVPETRVIQGIREKKVTEVSPADEQMYEKCSSSVGRAGFPELLAGLAGDAGLSNRMVQTAAALTERDPEYLGYREAWESCIATKGLKLAAENSWTVKTSDSKEDEIRTVLLDLGCKDSSGGAQTPYDIFAQYEAAQMKDHQAELNEVADQKAASVERAKQVLRDHGVADARL
ncbi:hypothetical protein [Paenarthrobacter histidinolovorans]|uniref:hypothetical protein n=1 Tax=Paenarthrobacter histidinolovorans TaxID=43664 RepID=UPI00166A5FF2|nr:hypothetical protein [Paenarthrobacter histidinolovorans]GGJ27041.1 hypothetical protein GCM10010052_24920 [Paenarthrobacter histidinolovorans]